MIGFILSTFAIILALWIWIDVDNLTKDYMETTTRLYRRIADLEKERF